MIWFVEKDKLILNKGIKILWFDVLWFMLIWIFIWESGMFEVFYVIWLIFCVCILIKYVNCLWMMCKILNDGENLF